MTITFLLVLVLSTCCLAGCVSAPLAFEDQTREATVTPIAHADYQDIAWVDDDVVALSRLDATGRDSWLDIVSLSSGELIDSIAFVREGDCHHRWVRALSPLPRSRVLFADVCEGRGGLSALTIRLRLYELATGILSDIGTLADQAWSIAPVSEQADFLYTAGTTLCWTIFHKTVLGDGPADLAVDVDGRRVRLGEDVLGDRDRCTHDGRAKEPAVSEDGTIAALVSPSYGVDGPARLDRPWTIVTFADETVRLFPWAIENASETAWINNEELLFTGSIQGLSGTWRTDGDGLARMSHSEIGGLAVSPDRTAVAGLIFVNLIDDAALEEAAERGSFGDLFVSKVVRLSLD